MGTNCAPLVADLFLYCYERDFMDSLNPDNEAGIIEAFNSTSMYLLNIDNPYFEGMVNQIYPPELQLNKATTTDTGQLTKCCEPLQKIRVRLGSCTPPVIVYY